MSSAHSFPLEHVVFTDFDGNEGILVDLNTKKYYQLNETAMLVWKGLEEKKSLNEIVQDVTAAYEVSAQHAEHSVERLLAHMKQYKLVG